MRRTIALALLACALTGCDTPPSPAPTPTDANDATPTAFVQVRPTRDVGPSARDLLATIPLTAGGVTLDGVEVIDDSINVGFAIDYVLEALGKRRPDAAFVSRYSESVSVSATRVDGIDGVTLLKTVVDTWDAPAVIRRSARPIGVGIAGWELEERLGPLTVIYRLGDVVYLVSSQDRAVLEAVLLDMPRQIP